MRDLCRYKDCENAEDNEVCPHEAEEDCDCIITCPVCRESLELPPLVRKFRVPVTWMVSGIIEVEATSREEAAEKVEDDDLPLPSASDFVGGSFEVDTSCIEPIEED